MDIGGRERVLYRIGWTRGSCNQNPVQYIWVMIPWNYKIDFNPQFWIIRDGFLVLLQDDGSFDKGLTEDVISSSSWTTINQIQFNQPHVLMEILKSTYMVLIL